MQRLQLLFQLRQRHEALGQTQQVPGVGRARNNSGHDALQVGDFLQAVGDGAPNHGVLHQLRHALADVVGHHIEVGGGQGDILGHLVHVHLGKAAASNSGAAHTQAAGLEGRTGIAGHLILIGGNTHRIQAVLQLLAGQITHVPQVDEGQMVVGAAGHQLHAPLHQAIGQGGGVLHHLLLIDLELRLEGLAQRHSLAGNDMHQRATLNTRENGFIKVIFLGSLFVCQNQSASWSSQGLVGRCCNHIRIRNRTFMKSCRNQTCNMCHINH